MPSLSAPNDAPAYTRRRASSAPPCVDVSLPCRPITSTPPHAGAAKTTADKSHLRHRGCQRGRDSRRSREVSCSMTDVVGGFWSSAVATSSAAASAPSRGFPAASGAEATAVDNDGASTYRTLSYASTKGSAYSAVEGKAAKGRSGSGQKKAVEYVQLINDPSQLPVLRHWGIAKRAGKRVKKRIERMLEEKPWASPRMNGDSTATWVRNWRNDSENGHKRHWACALGLGWPASRLSADEWLTTTEGKQSVAEEVLPSYAEALEADCASEDDICLSVQRQRM